MWAWDRNWRAMVSGAHVPLTDGFGWSTWTALGWKVGQNEGGGEEEEEVDKGEGEKGKAASRGVRFTKSVSSLRKSTRAFESVV